MRVLNKILFFTVFVFGCVKSGHIGSKFSYTLVRSHCFGFVMFYVLLRVYPSNVNFTTFRQFTLKSRTRVNHRDARQNRLLCPKWSRFLLAYDLLYFLFVITDWALRTTDSLQSILSALTLTSAKWAKWSYLFCRLFLDCCNWIDDHGFA